MKMAWVMGWAVPEPWFAPMAREAFPRAEHLFFRPNEAAIQQMEAAGPFDRVVGYSLGAHLLLASAARVAAVGRMALLAPIFAFPSEEDLGGRASRTQVRHLARWLRLTPHAALRDFYRRSGLDIPPSLEPGSTTAELQWGLDQLANVHVAPPLPAGWWACCGADDALLDAARLRAVDPRIAVVAHATHHPAALIQAFAAHERSLADPIGAAAR